MMRSLVEEQRVETKQQNPHDVIKKTRQLSRPIQSGEFVVCQKIKK
jgi:hypothetical protein